jgi:hypothetical protein
MAISTAPFVPAPLRVTLPSGGELQFCGHHARKHAVRLLEIGAGLSLIFKCATSAESEVVV